MPNTREKLIELLKESGVAFPISTANFLIVNGVTIATDNNVGHKWIPVTERLPVMQIVRYNDRVEPAGYGEYLESDPVQVFCRDGVFVAVCNKDNEDGGVAWLDYTSGSDLPATHWMHLPEPPKGE